MKKINHLIIIVSLILTWNISIASLIQPTTPHIFSGFPLVNNETPIKKVPPIDPSTVMDSAFNQELQWRILNLLAQQLFDRHSESLVDHLFSDRLIYATKTFSVSISSTDSNYYQVNIIDNQHGNKTQLEIPCL